MINALLKAALVCAIYTSAGHAFNLVPAPKGSGTSYVPSLPYELEQGKEGIVARKPISFTSIARGGTEEFLAVLRAEFPESEGWKFTSADEDLKGSFAVSAYYVFHNGTVGGGGIAFDYHPRDNDPPAGGNSELHWIQRVVSNHAKGAEHGVPENRIAFRGAGIRKKKPAVPFIDVVSKGGSSRSVPPHFESDIAVNDPQNEHALLSEVYLASVSKSSPKEVVIYNGVAWGWENRVSGESRQ